MATQKTQKIIRYICYGLLVLGVGGFLLYFLVIRNVQIHNQKQNFAKAEASLDTLEKQIEAKIGKPDDIKKEKSCGYASRVYGKGPRGCGVSLLILYTNRDYSSGNTILASVSDLLHTKIYDRLGRPDINQFSMFTGSGPDQAFSQSIPNTLGLSCSVQYLYPVIPLYDKDFANISGENIQIELSCGGSAMSEFYPIKN